MKRSLCPPCFRSSAKARIPARSEPTSAARATGASERARRKPGWLKDSLVDFESLRGVCPFCDKQFADETRMAAHVRQIHKKPFKCDLCRRQYYARESLDKHRKTHRTDTHFECRVCHLKYKREETLKSHLVRAHSDVEANFRCEHCGKRYKLKQDLALHINQVHLCKYQICRFCGKSVKNVKAHEWHHERKLAGPGDKATYSCGLCLKKFHSEAKLENHLMRHVQRFVCNECGESFTGPTTLMNHKTKHKPGINCFLCRKFFHSRSNYYQHVLMHAKVRAYKCDYCGDDFTQRSTLVRHRKSHPEDELRPLAHVRIADLARQVMSSYKDYVDED